MVDLSIIIVSWNCREYLEQCLRSIASSGIRHSYQVFVVDNGSSDGSISLVELSYPNVKLISNTENLGFAAANNQALRLVDSRFVVLLNPDTVVGSGALDAMIDFFERYDDAWAVGPAMVSGDGSVHYTGVAFPSNWNILVESVFLDRLFPKSRLLGAHKQTYEPRQEPRAVDYVQGACLMVKSKAIEKVGLLDERFFMYFEEVDWCYRIKKAGGEVWYYPMASVVHLGGDEFGHFDERRLVYYYLSLLLFYRKHYQTYRLFLLRCLLIMRSLIRIIVWGTVSIVRPSDRSVARSSQMGYVRTLSVLLKRV